MSGIGRLVSALSRISGERLSPSIPPSIPTIPKKTRCGPIRKASELGEYRSLESGCRPISRRLPRVGRECAQADKRLWNRWPSLPTSQGWHFAMLLRGRPRYQPVMTLVPSQFGLLDTRRPSQLTFGLDRPILSTANESLYLGAPTSSALTPCPRSPGAF